LNKRYKEINEEITGLITELIRGLRDIRVLNADTTFMNKMKSRITMSNLERYKMSGVLRVFNFITGSIQDSFTLLFIVLGVILINNKLLTISSLIILYMYQDRIYHLLSYVTRLMEIIKKFNVAASRVFEIIGNDKYKKEEFGKVSIKKIHGDFEFKNVNFSYKVDNLILKDISFKIKANHTTAFVGKSGGGKSTIFGLLTKLYSVDSGDILIDDNSIYNLTKDSIRNNISIITQSPYIFNFTIKENLQMVKENATDKEIIDVCKMACLHDFIMTLPEKYDTKVGEGGVSLSGGQRQRLAIARALLKKTEIILFDEATSALDNETQKGIQEAINNMKKEYTILIIAHRLSTIVESDNIIMIDDGKVIAEGTHEDLLNKCQEYRQLYKTEVEK
ncbi:MAG: ABC transporter ATP-binding protein, partial [Bacilli bacterium]